MSNIEHIGDLKPDKRNARKHNPRNVGMIASALQEVGAARSIVIDEEGNILAGNGTVEAAAQVGIERVKVVEADGETIVAVRRTGLSAEAKQRLALYDNRTAELADWDTDVLAGLRDEDALAGLFYDDELDALLASVEQVEPGDGGDDFDTTPADGPTRVQSGDLWRIGPHRLLCGDATRADDVARLMGGEKADCVFTSPPYAVGVDYGEYEDTIDNLRGMLPLLSRIWLEHVTPGGFAVVNFGDIASGRDVAESDTPCEYPMAVEYWPIFRADGWALWSRRVWCKPNARVNSLWCIQSNRAATDWEHIWTWKAPGTAIVARVDGDYRSPQGWIDTSRMEGVAVGKDKHGAGMAVSVAEWMLNVHSRTHNVVLEPFGGTGTTMIAAHRLARRCFASELSPKYCDVILRRAEAEGIGPIELEGNSGT